MNGPAAREPSAESGRSWAAAWTRDAEMSPAAGRPRIASELRAGALHLARHVRLRHVFEAGGWEMLRAAAIGLWGLVRLRPQPLQCILYSSPSMIRAALDEIGDARTVYVDGIRCLGLVRRLAGTGRRIVCDLDDLMSRRCRLQVAAGVAFSPGYLARHLPRPLRFLLGWIGRLLLRYEGWALARAERELGGLCSALVLLSPVEADELRGALPVHQRSKVHVVPPPQAVAGSPGPWQGPARFIFVGGENLPQNRLTLVRLFDLWRRNPSGPTLHWYGRREPGGLVPPEGVVCHGFVEDIRCAYVTGGVLLNPAGLAGGVKTKVLEAIAHGCPAAGNDWALEGLGWVGYPMRLSDEDGEWVHMITDPVQLQDRFRAAVEYGLEKLRTEHHPAVFNRRWFDLMADRAAPVADGSRGR